MAGVSTGPDTAVACAEDSGRLNRVGLLGRPLYPRVGACVVQSSGPGLPRRVQHHEIQKNNVRLFVSWAESAESRFGVVFPDLSEFVH